MCVGGGGQVALAGNDTLRGVGAHVPAAVALAGSKCARVGVQCVCCVFAVCLLCVRACVCSLAYPRFKSCESVFIWTSEGL